MMCLSRWSMHVHSVDVIPGLSPSIPIFWPRLLPTRLLMVILLCLTIFMRELVRLIMNVIFPQWRCDTQSCTASGLQTCSTVLEACELLGRRCWLDDDCLRRVAWCHLTVCDRLSVRIARRREGTSVSKQRCPFGKGVVRVMSGRSILDNAAAKR